MESTCARSGRGTRGRTKVTHAARSKDYSRLRVWGRRAILEEDRPGGFVPGESLVGTFLVDHPSWQDTQRADWLQDEYTIGNGLFDLVRVVNFDLRGRAGIYQSRSFEALEVCAINPVPGLRTIVDPPLRISEDVDALPDELGDATILVDRVWLTIFPPKRGGPVNRRNSWNYIVEGRA